MTNYTDTARNYWFSADYTDTVAYSNSATPEFEYCELTYLNHDEFRWKKIILYEAVTHPTT